jgi:hypothetical protein
VPGEYKRLPLDKKLLANIPESSLQLSQAAIENAFINESGGHSRFPGLRRFCTIPDGGRVYVHDWRGDIIGATSKGNIYRITPDGQSVRKLDGVPVAGGKRVTFTKTEDELVMAAGAQIVRVASSTAEILSATAPLASHVGFLDSFLIANEIRSGRFFTSPAGQWHVPWNPLDVFTAESNPDDIAALTVTPYRELLVAGVKSIEQFERITEGDAPFFRRWANGTGLSPDANYTLLATRSGTFCLNDQRQVVRFAGQSSTPQSDAIQALIEVVDDFTDAWASYLYVSGTEFLLLQFPEATNVYGTKGITICLDTRSAQWCFLYGWDSDAGLPRRWPGWSYHSLNGMSLVGGEGVIYVLDRTANDNDGEPARVLFRTGHYSQFGEVRVDDLRMRCQRGYVPSGSTEGKVRLRVRKNNTSWSHWIERGLGNTGDRRMTLRFGAFGYCHEFQVEIMVADPVPWEFVMLEAQMTRL